MKNPRFFIFVLVSLVLFSSSFCFAQLGEQEGKTFMSTATFFKPDQNLRAIYEINIWPVENISDPPGPLPDKNFFVNANCVFAGEDATFINALPSHTWWVIENKRISNDNGISLLTFNISGRWNPLRQQTSDWPVEERGCSVFKSEYQINNSIFGLFTAINDNQGNFGIILKKENNFWILDSGSRPGYRFPFPWGMVKKGKIATTWGSLKLKGASK